MRLSLGLFLSACVACLCLSGCSEEGTAKPSAPRPARITVVSPHKLTLVAQGAGRIGSRYVSEVGFEVGGRVVSRDVDVGAIVRKGQKLAELSAIDYRNKVSAAAADLAASPGGADPGSGPGATLSHPAREGLRHTLPV